MTTSTSAAPLVPSAATPNAKPARAPKPADKHGWWWGTGRRKTAVARCRLRPTKDGSGKVIFERHSKKDTRTVEEYFPEERDRADVLSPLKLTNTDGRFDVILKLHGGGLMGQAQASRLAIARALQAYDPGFDAALRDAGMLTRDAREVERKKYGQAGARRRFQFSKR